MPRIYKKNCDLCGTYYESAAKNFCSSKCYGNFRIGKYRPEISKPIGSKRKHKLSGRVEIKTELGWMREHRYLMEMRIGRKLLKDEVVHHLDENVENNTIENLVLMTHGEHTRLHSLGRTHSDATKEKIRQKALGRTGYVTSEETKKLISLRAKQRWAKWKKEGRYGII